MYQPAALSNTSFSSGKKSKGKNAIGVSNLMTQPHAMPQLMMNMQSQLDQFQNKMLESMKKMAKKVDDISREVKSTQNGIKNLGKKLHVQSAS